LNYKLTNYTSEDLKNRVKEKPFSHFVVDDFLDKDLFLNLDKDFREFYMSRGLNLDHLRQHRENSPNHKLLDKNFPIINWGKELNERTNGQVDGSFKLMGANVHHNNRTHGCTIDYGGGSKNLDNFQSLANHSSHWKSFLNVIYSSDFFEYMHDIFSETTELKDRIKDNPPRHVGTKINRYTDNYGWVIHRDTDDKILSFMLYLDNYDWPDDIKGNGTQLWEIGEEDTDLDTTEEYKYNGNSIDFQLKDGRFKRSSLLTNEQKKKIKIYKDIDFKPNRFIGFVRSNKSFHSILPMKLPDLVTRNCFQINIWESNPDE